MYQNNFNMVCKLRRCRWPFEDGKASTSLIVASSHLRHANLSNFVYLYSAIELNCGECVTVVIRNHFGQQIFYQKRFL